MLNLTNIPISEQNVEAVLLESQGDLFVASQLLGITAIKLDRLIRVSARLQVVHSELLSRVASQEYSKTASESVEQNIKSRVDLYRVVGLDSLHDLATMPISDNSAQNQVKLAAAARLAGETVATSGDSEVAEALRSLNDSYHKNAPRIRVTRERLTVEMQGEKEIN